MTMCKMSLINLFITFYLKMHDHNHHAVADPGSVKWGGVMEGVMGGVRGRGFGQEPYTIICENCVDTNIPYYCL